MTAASLGLPKRIYTGKEVERLYRDLEQVRVGAGVDFGAAQALVAGGGNVDGVAETAARSDHIHAWPTHHTSHESGGADAIKLDDLATPDDNTDLDSSTTKHGLLRKLSGNSSESLRGDGSWSSTPINTSSVRMFLANIHPSSPHGSDDEFDDGTITGWTDWDIHGSVLSKSESDGLSVSITPTAASPLACGVYKATPASEFVAYTLIRLDSAIITGGSSGGLAIFKNAAADDNWKEFSVLSDATDFVTRHWALYNSGAATSVVARGTVCSAMYVRIRLNGTACACDISSDGVTWLGYSTQTLAYTPQHIGFIVRTGTNSTTATTKARFIRFVTGAGCSAWAGSTLPGGAWKDVLYV